MKTFISPLYIQTNSLSAEKIVLGLIMISPENIFFDVSKSKMSLVEKLLDKSVKIHLNNSVQMIHNKIKENISSSVFNEEYFAYLSKYSNGLIQFGTPKPIAVESTESSFKELFKNFVGGNIEKEKISQQTFHAKIKEKLYIPGVIEKADISYILKPNKVEGVLKSTVVSLLTTNGNIQALQAIDFENSENVIANHIYEFEVLTKTLDKLSLKYLQKPGSYKIIINEPALGTEQHNLFDSIYRFKKDVFDIIDANQISLETSKIVNAPHLKFSTFLESKHL